MSKPDPRIAPKEMIVTRFKSAQQKRQLRDKDRSMTKVTQLLKSPPQKKLKKKVQKSPKKDLRVWKSPVEIDADESKDYYPDKLKRSFAEKKAFLKPKHKMKTVARTNKRKFFTPKKGMKSPPVSNKSPSDWSAVWSPVDEDVVKLMEDTDSLDDEDLMEILTCPSPVWWEPHDWLSEEPISFQNPEEFPERRPDEDRVLQTERDSEMERVYSDIENVTSSFLSNSNIRDTSLKREEKKEVFKKKQKKLENLLGNIKSLIKNKDDDKIDIGTDKSISIDRMDIDGIERIKDIDERDKEIEVGDVKTIANDETTVVIEKQLATVEKTAEIVNDSTEMSEELVVKDKEEEIIKISHSEDLKTVVKKETEPIGVERIENLTRHVNEDEHAIIKRSESKEDKVKDENTELNQNESIKIKSDTENTMKYVRKNNVLIKRIKISESMEDIVSEVSKESSASDKGAELIKIKSNINDLKSNETDLESDAITTVANDSVRLENEEESAKMQVTEGVVVNVLSKDEINDVKIEKNNDLNDLKTESVGHEEDFVEIIPIVKKEGLINGQIDTENVEIVIRDVDDSKNDIMNEKNTSRQKISMSTEDDLTDLCFRDDEMLSDLENMDIPIENDLKPSSDNVIVINDENDDCNENGAVIYLVDNSDNNGGIEISEQEFDEGGGENLEPSECKEESFKNNDGKDFNIKIDSIFSITDRKLQVPTTLPPLKKRPKFETPAVITPIENATSISNDNTYATISENLQFLDSDTINEIDNNKYIILNESSGSNIEDFKSNKDEFVTVYKIMSNNTESKEKCANKFKNIPEYSNYVQNLKDFNDETNLKGQLNSFYKKCKNSHRKKCKRTDSDVNSKALPESICESCEPKNAMTVAQEDNVKYCFKCSSIFNTDECKYCINTKECSTSRNSGDSGNH